MQLTKNLDFFLPKQSFEFNARNAPYPVYPINCTYFMYEIDNRSVYVTLVCMIQWIAMWYRALVGQNIHKFSIETFIPSFSNLGSGLPCSCNFYEMLWRNFQDLRRIEFQLYQYLKITVSLYFKKSQYYMSRTVRKSLTYHSCFSFFLAKRKRSHWLVI